MTSEADLTLSVSVNAYYYLSPAAVHVPFLMGLLIVPKLAWVSDTRVEAG
jgi:hypothetical protein